MPASSWDVYCRVIDNLGDAGVCWRLASGLAARGQRVRLVIDDAAPLALMAPQGVPGVEVLPWPGPAVAGDVVVEAFGCDPPPATVAAMAQRALPPVWINLEYLSAEPYVERSHGLPSPQGQGPGRGLTKWFFYPGFTPRTGGLLREPGLLAERDAFDRAAWLRAQGIAALPGERVVSLFCYANAALPALLDDLARQPTLLLLTPGPAQQQVVTAPAGVRLQRLRWLTQAGYDRLLWACDLNFVRGEDSLVRAVWAGAPFVWQAYPQPDGAHAGKVLALLQAWAPPAAVAALWQSWNGLRRGWPGLPPGCGAGRGAGPASGSACDWVASLQRWRQALAAQPDLVTQLMAFVRAHPHKP